MSKENFPLSTQVSRRGAIDGAATYAAAALQQRQGSPITFFASIRQSNPTPPASPRHGEPTPSQSPDFAIN